MKIRLLPCLLSVFVIGLSVAHNSYGQAPRKVYSEVYFHKIKPGHTFAEARAIENEFKKIHQVQANDGFILGWYMLSSYLTTNPANEYDYVTIKNFTDPGYMDNSYPQKYLTGVMGTDYQTKLNDLSKRMQDVKEVVKAEIWEHMDGAAPNTMTSPDKSPVWLSTNMKIKNGQYEEYIARAKKLQPFYQEQINQNKLMNWSFAGLMLPWAREKAYDFASVIQFPSMKALLASYNLDESVFKKAMPGVDSKQFFKELDDIREPARQEVYYLLEFAVKSSATQASK